MSITFAIALFIIGLLLVVYFSEKLVEGAVGTSLRFGISAFLISVVFIGFDPENLALGGVASYEQASGIALGTIFGAAMVAIALAFGITALIAPMKFDKAPPQVVIIPVLSVIFIGLLSFDGLLSRLDGVYLLAGFFLALWYLARLTTKGLDITPGGEVGEVLEKETDMPAWKAIALLAFFLFNAGVIALINPIPVSAEVFYFHLPMCMLSVFFISFCMLWKQVPRWAGGVLVLFYIVFFAGSYLI